METISATVTDQFWRFVKNFVLVEVASLLEAFGTIWKIASVVAVLGFHVSSAMIRQLV